MNINITAGAAEIISAIASSVAVVIAVLLAYQANRKADKLGRISAYRDALPLSSATWSVVGACESHRRKASAASRLAYEYRTGFGAGAGLTPADRASEETKQLEIEREQDAKRARLGKRVNQVRAQCHQEANTLREVSKSCRALVSVRSANSEVGLALSDGVMTPLHALIKAPDKIAELKSDPTKRSQLLDACRALRAAIDETLLESFVEGAAQPAPDAWRAMRTMVAI